MSLDIKLPCEKVFEAFTDTTALYNRKYGEGNVKIKDELGNTVHQARIVNFPEKNDISELIEFTCFDNDDKQIIRLIHFSQFNVTFEISMTP